MNKKLLFIIGCFLFIFPGDLYSLSFTDSTGKELVIESNPLRVVSLVPSITEILVKLELGDILVGQTHHSPVSSLDGKAAIVGGFRKPNIDLIKKLKPDLLFYSPLQKEVADSFAGKVKLISLNSNSIEESFLHIRLLGTLFGTEERALEIISSQQKQLDIIAGKTQNIPKEKRLRVVRLMGSSSLLVPGDDSFQNGYINRAGGVAPSFGGDGHVMKISASQWQDFNPQVIYACGKSTRDLPILEQEGIRDVDAVQQGKILFFPCDLTCRVSTHSGDFVSLLSANLYPEWFSDPANYILEEKVVERKALPLDLSYIEKSELLKSSIRDFENKTIVLSFTKPLSILSTLEGTRDGITHVGNHYFPPPSWGLGHEKGLENLNEKTLKVLNLKKENTSLLYTGADMDNHAMVTKTFRDLSVTAIATAGVAGNAVRMSRDEGRFYEPGRIKKKQKPGTINILLLANAKLSPRAMTRAIISATEGKSAALQDMDIRSSYTPAINPATGTGTDNILVVSGEGVAIDATGGHTKAGELIAKAVYEAVTRAIFKQNRYTESRSVFQRLKERKINIRKLTKKYLQSDQTALETILLSSSYSSFLEAALVISDSYERNLISDISGFEMWCDQIAQEIAGKPTQMIELDEDIPVIIKKAFGALITGIKNSSKVQ